MSVLEAVTRAMRSGHVVIPSEFPSIQREALATIDISQMHPGDYLLGGADAEALRGASFRNPEEQRAFYVSFLHQARDRVLTQLQAAMARRTTEQPTSLGCFTYVPVGTAAQYTPASCFESGAFRSMSEAAAGHPGFSSGLLHFLGQSLPAPGFLGVPGSSSSFSEIQLLDGVMFTSENMATSSLPADTRINSSTLRVLYRAAACTEGSTLTDCR